MAYSGSHLAPTGYRWREHWGLVRDESLASQDHAQEVQIRDSFDYHRTNRALSLLDGKIVNYLSERFLISRVISI